MVDKNGRQIQTGDVVLVSGGYFKADNGLFAVIHAPGDPGWYGESCCLNKLCRSGKLSEGKYANLKVWNDGAEAQLRTYNRINCVGEYDIDDAVAALTGKGVKKE